MMLKRINYLANESHISGQADHLPHGNEVLECDFLVVGAGATGMSFIDTMLTENPKATIILVDKNTAPGGHWTKAYDFVRLHQPSCFYGVNSLPLGKHRSKRNHSRERYDLNDRATKSELLDYYRTVLNNFEATGRVKSFFGATYEYSEVQDKHTIYYNTGCHGLGSECEDKGTTTSNMVEIEVMCHKVVTVASNVVVPSMREPLIPVDKQLVSNFVPVNEVSSRVASGRYNRYIVFGCGKTGIDAITHILEDEATDPSQITWIINRDAWYMVADEFKNLSKAMATTANRILSSKSVKTTFLGLEKDGVMARLDRPFYNSNRKKIDVIKNYNFPTVFRGASVTLEHLDQIRSVKNVVRMGRATSIGPHTVHLERGSLEFSPKNTLLVDCMGGDFYGYESISDDFRFFEKNRINLGPSLGFFNTCLTAAVVAFLESSLGGSSGNINTNDEIILQKQNDCCFFLRGKHVSSPDMLIGMMYTEAKYVDNLVKNVPGALKFLMESRVNMNSPKHRKHGTAKLLWTMFGPAQMHKFPKKMIRKIESGEFSDIDHLFGNGDNKTTSVGAMYSERRQRGVVKQQPLVTPKRLTPPVVLSSAESTATVRGWE